MANFAEIVDGQVVRVIVISNDDIKDESGVEQEQIGIDICNRLVGQSKWVQTSFNNNFRKMYGPPGFCYNEEKDVFYNPVGPYPSWVLNDNYDWVAPAPKPDEPCVWDESLLSWVLINDLPT